MTTRWLVIVVVSVFVVVLSAALALTGDDEERGAAPALSPTPGAPGSRHAAETLADRAPEQAGSGRRAHPLG